MHLETEHKEYKKSLAKARIHLVEAWGRGMPKILHNALNASFKEIKMIIPDKPCSRLKKYRLTQAGKQLLKHMEI